MVYLVFESVCDIIVLVLAITIIKFTSKLLPRALLKYHMFDIEEIWKYNPNLNVTFFGQELPLNCSSFVPSADYVRKKVKVCTT